MPPIRVESQSLKTAAKLVEYALWLGASFSLALMVTALLSATDPLGFSVESTVEFIEGEWLVLSTSILIALVLGSIAALARRWRTQVPVTTDDVTASDASMSLTTVAEWLSRAQNDYSATELQALYQLVLNSRSRVHRIIHTVILGEWSIHHKMTREILPAGFREKSGPSISSTNEAGTAQADADTQRFFVPVMERHKGRLIDEFNLFIEDKPGKTVGYAEGQALSIAVAQGLLAAAVDGQLVVENERTKWLEILQSISDPQPSAGSQQSGLVDELLGLLGERSRGGRDAAQLESFVRFMQTHYVVYAEVQAKPGDRVAMRTEWRSPYTVRIERGERLRTFLGLAARQVSIDLGEAAVTRSFHLRVDAPDGMYFNDASYRTFGTHARQSWRDAVAQATRETRTNGILGRDHAHVYLRDSDLGDQALGKTRLGLNEIPPGIMAPITLLSLGLTSVIWLVGAFHDCLFPILAASGGANRCVSGSGAVAPLPTIMLAVFSLVSAWLLSRLGEAALRRASVRSVLLLVAETLLGLVAVLVVVLKPIVQSPWKAVSPIVSSELQIRIEHPLWWLLMCLSLGLSIITIGVTVSRYRTFKGQLTASARFAEE